MSHLSEAIRMAGMQSFQDDDTYDPDRDLDEERAAPSMDEDIDSSFAALAALFDEDADPERTPYFSPSPKAAAPARRPAATTRPEGTRPLSVPAAAGAGDEASRVTVRVPPPPAPSPPDDLRERMTVRVPSTPKIRLRAPEPIDLELDEPGIDVDDNAHPGTTRSNTRAPAGNMRPERSRSLRASNARTTRPARPDAGRSSSVEEIESEPIGAIAAERVALVVYRGPSFVHTAHPVQIIEAPASLPAEMTASCSAPSVPVRPVPVAASRVVRPSADVALPGEPPRARSGSSRWWTTVSVAIVAAAALVTLAIQQRVGVQASAGSASVAAPVAPPLLAQTPPGDRRPAAPRPARTAEPTRPEPQEESTPATTAAPPARAPRRSVAPPPAPAPEASVSQSGRIMGNEEQ